MSKHKRKGSPLKSQKIALAQSKNEFFSNLKQFCDKVTANPAIYKLIPERDLEVLFLARYRPVRMRAAEGNKMPSSMKKYCQDYVSSMLKFRKVPFVIGELTEISIFDYYSVAFTLATYAKSLIENNIPALDVLRKALEPLDAKINDEGRHEPWKQYHETMNSVALIFCNLDTGLFTAKSERRQNVETGDVGFCMETYCLQTEKIQISVEGKNRPAHRVGWFNWQPSLHINYIAAKSEDLGLMAGLKLDVYIQNHALDRLQERMDGMNTGALHLCIIESIKNPKVCHNKNGDLLIEFIFFGNKTGYFRADVANGQLLLRTFLFMTNNGTPEGEKLHRNTGIMKEDKMYLAIDKISTFLNSDITNNPRVKQLFLDAGCESLFKVEKWAYFGERNDNQSNHAELVSKYLSLDKGDDATLIISQ